MFSGKRRRSVSISRRSRNLLQAQVVVAEAVVAVAQPEQRQLRLLQRPRHRQIRWRQPIGIPVS
jgi:hypothetical protein